MSNKNSLRRMEYRDLALVLLWRNSIKIRNLMINTQVITEGDHQNWFATKINDKNVRLLIYEVDSVPRGFIKIEVTEATNTAEWGFYLSPDAQRGTGYEMGRQTLNYVFLKLGIHKLCGQVLSCNLASQRFHKKLGFVEEFVIRKPRFPSNEFVDVHCFGLVRKNWREFAVK